MGSGTDGDPTGGSAGGGAGGMRTPTHRGTCGHNNTDTVTNTDERANRGRELATLSNVLAVCVVFGGDGGGGGEGGEGRG